jgi:hypothetical protein
MAYQKFMIIELHFDDDQDKALVVDAILRTGQFVGWYTNELNPRFMANKKVNHAAVTP